MPPRKVLIVSAMILLGIIALGLLVWVYGTYAPESSLYFPKCPTLQYLGLECPGCGSQRAVHALLNFEILEAIRYNILAVLFIPYALIWLGFTLYFRFSGSYSPVMLRWRRGLFSTRAILVIIVLITLFCVVRNFTSAF